MIKFQSKEKALIKRLTRSKRVIHNLGKVEYFAQCEVSSKTQCSSCSKYWGDRVVYCTCGSCLIPTDNLVVINKREIWLVVNTPLGHKEGVISRCTTSWKDWWPTWISSGKGVLAEREKQQFQVYSERFQKQDAYRESQIAFGWTERFDNNWKLAFNAQGPISPMYKREDCLDAVKTIKNPRQQDAQPRNPSNLPSYQTGQRPFQERHQERQWKWHTWSDSSSSCFHGQGRNLGGLVQSGRTTNNLKKYKVFRLQEMANPL